MPLPPFNGFGSGSNLSKYTVSSDPHRGRGVSPPTPAGILGLTPRSYHDNGSAPTTTLSELSHAAQISQHHIHHLTERLDVVERNGRKMEDFLHSVEALLPDIAKLDQRQSSLEERIDNHFEDSSTRQRLQEDVRHSAELIAKQDQQLATQRRLIAEQDARLQEQTSTLACLQSRLDELATQQSELSSRSRPRRGANTDLDDTEDDGPSKRRRGGGGFKRNKPANDACRRLLRRAMQIHHKAEMPAYPLPSGVSPSDSHDFVSFAGFKQAGFGMPEDDVPAPDSDDDDDEEDGSAGRSRRFKKLRLDWAAMLPGSDDFKELVTALTQKIVRDAKRLDVSNADEKVIAQCCCTSIDRMRQEVMAREKNPEAYYSRKEHQNRKGCHAMRTKDTGRLRKANWKAKRRSGVEGQDGRPEGEVDLFDKAMISEDDTDTESPNAVGTIGRAKRPCWRSKEGNDAQNYAEDGLERPNAKHLVIRDASRLSDVPLEPLPSSVQRIAVARSWAMAYPRLVPDVSQNTRVWPGRTSKSWGSDVPGRVYPPAATGSAAIPALFQ